MDIIGSILLSLVGMDQTDAAVKMPMKEILKRMDDCIFPGDKDAIVDYIEIIEIKMSTARGREKFDEMTDQFREFYGIQLVLDMMRQMVDDAEAMRICIALWEVLKSTVPVVMEFILQGGLDVLKQVKHDHEADEFLSIAVPKLIEAVLIVGAKIAVKEIKHEGGCLQMCQKCQQTVERARKLGSMSDTKIPASSDRVNRVTSFMESYLDKVHVQVQGLDAVLAFAHNPDSKSSIRDTKVVEVVGASYQEHMKLPDVVWRAAMVLSIVAQYGQDISYEITDRGIHELAAKSFKFMKADPRVRQQIVWLLSALLEFPKCRSKLQHSKECMYLFKELFEDRDEKVKNLDMDPKTKFVPYEVVVTLPIRQFMRETGGELIVEKKEKVKHKKSAIQERLKILTEPKPKYGTIYSKIFDKGEAGLVDDEDDEPPEEEAVNVAAKSAEDEEEKRKESTDWTAKLSYGERKKKKTKENRVVAVK